DGAGDSGGSCHDRFSITHQPPPDRLVTCTRSPTCTFFAVAYRVAGFDSPSIATRSRPDELGSVSAVAANVPPLFDCPPAVPRVVARYARWPAFDAGTLSPETLRITSPSARSA